MTWSTVTGSRAPWSFHTAVIPRLRAIRPVRIESGVHFATRGVASADEVLATGAALCTADELICLIDRIAGDGLWLNDQSLSMSESFRAKRLFFGVRPNWDLDPNLDHPLLFFLNS